MKNFFLKKSLSAKLMSTKEISSVSVIKSVGLLIDESNFNKKEDLIKEITLHGILKSNIEVLVFRDKFSKNEVFHHPTFSYKHLAWNSTFSEPVVNNFINEKFDLLISFYEIEKVPLMIVTNESNASFKVGFASVDKRLNNILINTQQNNYNIFVHELFRYLKILKRF